MRSFEEKTLVEVNEMTKKVCISLQYPVLSLKLISILAHSICTVENVQKRRNRFKVCAALLCHLNKVSNDTNDQSTSQTTVRMVDSVEEEDILVAEFETRMINISIFKR